MGDQWISALGTFLAVGAALLNLIVSDWRRRVVALAVQGVGFFLLCFQSLPLILSLVKFVESWTAVAIIGTGIASVASNSERSKPVVGSSNESPSFPFSARAFRLAAALLVGIALPQAVWYLTSVFSGLRFFHALTALALSGIALLILSFRISTLSTAIALITFLQGFEILLAALEPSVLLIGLLAGVVLSTASLGAYLLRTEEERQNR